MWKGGPKRVKIVFGAGGGGHLRCALGGLGVGGVLESK